ncbi:MAG: DUF465 domain-containing protein [Pseudomonadota bacterium]
MTLLLKKDVEFKRLFRDHQSLEEALGKINSQRYVSLKDEVERKRIQKLKLKRKDEMERILLLARKRTAGNGVSTS